MAELPGSHGHRLWGAAAHDPRRSAPSVVPHRRRMRFYRDELGFWRANQAVVEATRQYFGEAGRRGP